VITTWTGLALAAAAPLPVPTLDHSRAAAVRPIHDQVLVCADPSMLAPARIVWKALSRGASVPGGDRLMDAGRCTPVLNREPYMADFQEDVRWAASIRRPLIQRGMLRVVRLRQVLSPGPDGGLMADGFVYGAAEDFELAR